MRRLSVRLVPAADAAVQGRAIRSAALTAFIVVAESAPITTVSSSRYSWMRSSTTTKPTSGSAASRSSGLGLISARDGYVEGCDRLGVSSRSSGPRLIVGAATGLVPIRGPRIIAGPGVDVGLGKRGGSSRSSGSSLIEAEVYAAIFTNERVFPRPVLIGAVRVSSFDAYRTSSLGGSPALVILSVCVLQSTTRTRTDAVLFAYTYTVAPRQGTYWVGPRGAASKSA